MARGARGGYTGGSSKIYITQNGTGWERPWHQSDPQPDRFRRWDTRDAISEEEMRARFRKEKPRKLMAGEKRDGFEPRRFGKRGCSGCVYRPIGKKELFDFIGLCAAAFLEDTLTPNFPAAAGWLKKEIDRAGGNGRWLGSNHQIKKTFIESLRRHKRSAR